MKTRMILKTKKWWLLLVVALALIPWAVNADDKETLDRQLIQAAEEGDLEGVRTLLARGAGVKATNADGYTALRQAAFSGRADVVKLLLHEGADVNGKDEGGGTPLMAAVSSGNADVVKILLDGGADINAKGQSGCTALEGAAAGRDTVVFNLLKARGAEVTLELAVLLGDVDEVQRLIEAGADVNARDRFGRVVLMAAASEGLIEVAKLLLDKGADVNAKEEDGGTVLMTAAGGGYRELVRFLLSRGADIHASDADGHTALSHAKMEGHEEIVALLRGRVADYPIADCNRMFRGPAHKPRSLNNELATYPHTPEGVVEAFLRQGLADLPITVEEMRSCMELFDIQREYLPDEEDLEANCRRPVFSYDSWSGSALGRLHIVTGFDIREVTLGNNRASVKVVFRRLGWIERSALEPVDSRLPRLYEEWQKEEKAAEMSRPGLKVADPQAGQVPYEESSRVLHPTDDHQEVIYDLAKPDKF